MTRPRANASVSPGRASKAATRRRCGFASARLPVATSSTALCTPSGWRAPRYASVNPNAAAATTRSITSTTRRPGGNAVVAGRSCAPRRVSAGFAVDAPRRVRSPPVPNVKTPDDPLQGTFAATLLQGQARVRARRIIAAPARAVDRFFDPEGAPPVGLVAELGLSLETVNELRLYFELRLYVRALSDRALAAMAEVMRGGVIDAARAESVIRPLATRVAELEGRTLGGFLGDVIVQWLQGVAFARIRRGEPQLRLRRREDVISIAYSRVQYRLPWRLYAFDRLVDDACRRRIPYAAELQSMAYLADAGVPDLAALWPVGLDFERVDATRVAAEYRRVGVARARSSGIASWIVSERRDAIIRVVRGFDRRRLDFGLDRLMDGLGAEVEREGPRA